MLNVDYKILAKILLNRMKTVANQIVNANQTCSVKGRDIRDGALTVINLISHISKQNEEAAILSVDHQTAFDVVEREFIFATLKKFGFGENFVKWIQVIYKTGKTCSSVLVNGYLSETFTTGRGIRQGCPLSALLYVLVSEMFCNNVRAVVEIPGINLFGNELKITCYADDTNFFGSSACAVAKILDLYKRFNGASGATLNEGKTKILLLGSSQCNEGWKRYENLIVDKLKIYGYIYDRNGFATADNFLSFEESLAHLKALTPHAELSLVSKVQLVNTYYLSKLWYVACYIKPPDAMVKKLESVVDRFVWHPSKQNKIRKGVIKNSKEHGGIGYHDVTVKVNAMRLMLLIRRMCRSEATDWEAGFDDFLDRFRVSPVNTHQEVSGPTLYSEIYCVAKAVNFRTVNNTTVSLLGIELKVKEINTKLIYDLLIRDKYKNETRKIKTYWEDFLQIQGIEFEKYWSVSFPKFIDAFSKDIHYCVMHNANFTRNRLAKWKQIDAHCQHCLKVGISEVETVYHAFVACPRVSVFWAKVESLINDVDDGGGLTVENKIFGFKVGKVNEDKLNIIINLCQKAIWVTRHVTEQSQHHVDIWKHFKELHRRTVCKASRYLELGNLDRLFGRACAFLHKDVFI